MPKSLPRDPQMHVRDAPGVPNEARRLPKGPRRTALEWYMVCVVVVAAVAVVLCRLVLRGTWTALEWYMVCVVVVACVA